MAKKHYQNSKNIKRKYVFGTINKAAFQRERGPPLSGVDLNPDGFLFLNRISQDKRKQGRLLPLDKYLTQESKYEKRVFDTINKAAFQRESEPSLSRVDPNPDGILFLNRISQDKRRQERLLP
ncbi:hypothetical protein CDAR_480291 [Caerostris darwini]|uniref:Uncharacterized protein n=1 Tax=Caerostris darwini TaxID=1538125 RepID=A0AAV4V266_9ARAC|nr:hypothetical protein CDAR_480291 [Caerostris darwini]